MSHTASPPGQPHIFIVEDDDAVRESLVLLAEGEGFSVSAYSDGESFLNEAEPTGGDIVLLDLDLPGVGGADIAAALRKRGQHCRVAVISGLRRRAFDDGVNEVKPVAAFRKPLDHRQILETVLGSAGL